MQASNKFRLPKSHGKFFRNRTRQQHISILLGVIDAASEAGAKVVFSDVKEDTAELFEMLGLNNHVIME